MAQSPDHVSIRYIVNNVDQAIDFYTRNLGFTEVMHPAAEFAILSRGNLRLLLSQPSGKGGGGQSMTAGRAQTPGGWNRFELEIDDIETTVANLKQKGCKFRSEIISGVGGKQIILEDPSGNPVELFQYY